MAKFQASVAAWVNDTKGALLAVRNESANRVIEIAQTPVGKGGNMPVKTGFLRISGQATNDGSLPLQQKRPEKAADNSFHYESGPVALVIAAAGIDDVITFAYTANYAKFVEAKRKFVALAAQQWPQIVGQVVKEIRP